MALQELVHYVHSQRNDFLRRQEPIPPSERFDEEVGMGGWVPRPDVFGEDLTHLDPRHVDRPDSATEVTGAPLTLPPEAIAWYCPFHFYKAADWGIYYLESGLVNLAAALGDPRPGWDQLEAALAVLAEHEARHCGIEAMATRYESIMGADFYRPYFLSRQGHLDEEALCNAIAARSVRRSHPHLSPAVERWMAACPPGYADFKRFLSPPEDAEGRDSLMELMHQVHGIRRFMDHQEFMTHDLGKGEKKTIPSHLILDGSRHRRFLPKAFLGSMEERGIQVFAINPTV